MPRETKAQKDIRKRIDRELFKSMGDAKDDIRDDVKDQLDAFSKFVKGTVDKIGSEELTQNKKTRNAFLKSVTGLDQFSKITTSGMKNIVSGILDDLSHDINTMEIEKQARSLDDSDMFRNQLLDQKIENEKLLKKQKELLREESIFQSEIGKQQKLIVKKEKLHDKKKKEKEKILHDRRLEIEEEIREKNITNADEIKSMFDNIESNFNEEIVQEYKAINEERFSLEDKKKAWEKQNLEDQKKTSDSMRKGAEKEKKLKEQIAKDEKDNLSHINKHQNKILDDLEAKNFKLNKNFKDNLSDSVEKSNAKGWKTPLKSLLSASSALSKTAEDEKKFIKNKYPSLVKAWGDEATKPLKDGVTELKDDLGGVLGTIIGPELSKAFGITKKIGIGIFGLTKSLLGFGESDEQSEKDDERNEILNGISDQLNHAQGDDEKIQDILETGNKKLEELDKKQAKREDEKLIRYLKKQKIAEKIGIDKATDKTHDIVTGAVKGLDFKKALEPIKSLKSEAQINDLKPASVVIPSEELKLIPPSKETLLLEAPPSKDLTLRTDKKDFSNAFKKAEMPKFTISEGLLSKYQKMESKKEQGKIGELKNTLTDKLGGLKTIFSGQRFKDKFSGFKQGMGDRFQGMKNNKTGGGITDRITGGINKLARSAGPIIAIAGAFFLMGKSLQVFENIKWSSIAKGGVALVGFSSAISFLSKMARPIIKGSAVLAILGASLIPLTIGLEKMVSIGIGDIMKTVVAIGAFAGIATILSGVAPAMLVGAFALSALGGGLAVFGMGLKQITEPIIDLSYVDLDELEKLPSILDTLSGSLVDFSKVGIAGGIAGMFGKMLGGDPVEMLSNLADLSMPLMVLSMVLNQLGTAVNKLAEVDVDEAGKNLKKMEKFKKFSVFKDLQDKTMEVAKLDEMKPLAEDTGGAVQKLEGQKVQNAKSKAEQEKKDKDEQKNSEKRNMLEQKRMIEKQNEGQDQFIQVLNNTAGTPIPAVTVDEVDNAILGMLVKAQIA